MGEIQHYSAIRNFNRLVSGQISSRGHSVYCCRKCLNAYSTPECYLITLKTDVMHNALISLKTRGAVLLIPKSSCNLLLLSTQTLSLF